MEDNKDFPRFQYSVMFGPNREKQIVIRNNDWTVFSEDVKKISDIVFIEKKDEPQTQQQGLSATCTIHNVKMYEGHAKKDGHAYWYHKCDDGTYCYGKKQYTK